MFLAMLLRCRKDILRTSARADWAICSKVSASEVARQGDVVEALRTACLTGGCDKSRRTCIGDDKERRIASPGAGPGNRFSFSCVIENSCSKSGSLMVCWRSLALLARYSAIASCPAEADLFVGNVCDRAITNEVLGDVLGGLKLTSGEST